MEQQLTQTTQDIEQNVDWKVGESKGWILKDKPQPRKASSAEKEVSKNDNAAWMEAYKGFSARLVKNERIDILISGKTGKVNHLDHHITLIEEIP